MRWEWEGESQAEGRACSRCRRTPGNLQGGGCWPTGPKMPSPWWVRVCVLVSQPKTCGRSWGQVVPAITQRLPWMSLLCCVNNAGEHLGDHEKPSLEVAASWGRPGRKRQDQTYVQVLGGCLVSPSQQCCPTIAAVVTPRPSCPASPGAGLIL